jgi:hypothetical protein
MSDVNHELRQQLRRLQSGITEREFKALVSRLADHTVKWLEEDRAGSIVNPVTRAHVIRTFRVTLMEVINLRPVPTPGPVEEDSLLKQVKTVFGALVRKPVLAMAIRDGLNKVTFAGPWQEEAMGYYIRRNLNNPTDTPYGIINLQEKSMDNTGNPRETWRVVIWLPGVSEPGTATQPSYEDAKAMVDLALLSEGIVLLDRDPIKVPRR